MSRGRGKTPGLLSGEVDPEARLDERAITDEWQPICLNYTSGTTGNPKGVVCHARGAFLNAMGNALSLGFGAGTRYLWTLPMFHCNGWAHTWAVTAAGGTHVCLDAVEPATILDLVANAGYHPHVLRAGGCSTCCSTTRRSRPLKGTDRRVLRRHPFGGGGAAPTASLISQLDAIGFDLVHLYGLTESYGGKKPVRPRSGNWPTECTMTIRVTKAEWPCGAPGRAPKTSGDIRIGSPRPPPPNSAETGEDQTRRFSVSGRDPAARQPR